VLHYVTRREASGFLQNFNSFLEQSLFRLQVYFLQYQLVRKVQSGIIVSTLC